MDYEIYMRRALELAAQAAAEGDVPVGCVIADGAGTILGEGRNRREATHSVLGHAEIEALDGTVPDISRLLLSFTLASEPALPSDPISVDAGLSLADAFVTLSGGITINKK